MLEVSPEIALDMVNPKLLSTPTHLKATYNNTTVIEDLALSEDDSTISNISLNQPEIDNEVVVIIHDAGTQTEEYSVPIPESFLAPDICETAVIRPPVPDALIPSQQVLDNHLLTVWSNIHKYWDTVATHNPKLAADWAIDTENLLKNMSLNV
jgi:hypothetical protein